MSFTCVLIGEGTLPLQCAQSLLLEGHRVHGIVSSDASFLRWAQGKGIPHAEPTQDLAGFLSRQPFDYLFSIVNEHILSHDVLRIPGTCSIYYHDSPLPRYAGTHATSWALMNREKCHGVTWHVISDRVDAGDILKQRLVEVEDNETAFTLNGKCYEAAISSFAELVEELSCGRAVAKKQDLTERTFHARYRRPPAGCIFSWSRDALDISACVRALDFGPYQIR